LPPSQRSDRFAAGCAFVDLPIRPLKQKRQAAAQAGLVVDDKDSQRGTGRITQLAAEQICVQEWQDAGTLN
jgi:hypothetical protein